MKGYVGEILVVDLSTSRISSEQVRDEIYEKFLSGVGIGVYYLFKNIPEEADSLGPDNIIGFTSGLMTGTGSLVTGRRMAVCKSPLTGGWGDANCGGICHIRGIRYGQFSHTHKPEYETWASFGSLIMNKDSDAVFLH